MKMGPEWLIQNQKIDVKNEKKEWLSWTKEVSHY